MTQRSRYHRQELIPDVGPEGQERLRSSHVVLVGCGALGCVTADLLVRAGVGTLTVIDRDVVELTNLQRQVLFTETDARDRVPKATAAADRLRAVNSGVRIRPVIADLSPHNARTLLDRAASQADTEDGPHGAGAVSLLLDGTDNFETRFLLNDLAVQRTVPLVYAGAVGTHATLASILPVPPEGVATPWEPGPCLRCLIDEPPAPGVLETCDTAGVLGPVVGTIASLQALESMKILLGLFDKLRRVMLAIDPWNVEQQRIGMPAGSQSPECPCCALRRFDALEGAYGGEATTLCGRDAVQIAPNLRGDAARVDLGALGEALGSRGRFVSNPLMVRGRLDDEPGLELTVFGDGRAIIAGTTDPDRARSVYARYIGR